MKKQKIYNEMDLRLQMIENTRNSENLFERMTLNELLAMLELIIEFETIVEDCQTSHNSSEMKYLH